MQKEISLIYAVSPWYQKYEERILLIIIPESWSFLLVLILILSLDHDRGLALRRLPALALTLALELIGGLVIAQLHKVLMLVKDGGFISSVWQWEHWQGHPRLHPHRFLHAGDISSVRQPRPPGLLLDHHHDATEPHGIVPCKMRIAHGLYHRCICHIWFDSVQKIE